MTLSVYYPRPSTDPVLCSLRVTVDPQAVRLQHGELADTDKAWEVLVEGRPEPDLLDASPALRHLVVPYAGIPQRTRDVLAERPQVRLHNLHHNAAPTAEMALGLLLAAAKRMIPADQALRRGDWRMRYDDEDTPLLEGRRALILGYGHIGKRLAKALTALGLEVLATRLRAKGEKRDRTTGAHVYPARKLHEVLRIVQVVLIALPATPATEGLLDRKRLNLLQSGSLLVNVGRAAIVEEEALYHSLRNGRLAAAGLDVWYRYPASEGERTNTLPSAYPFHELDNVVLSPHRAGHGESSERLRAQHLAELLNRLAQGETEANRVHLEAGY